MLAERQFRAFRIAPSDSLPSVKLLRLWLLVLLAVLLPVRGAMAATMLCAPTGSGQHQTTAPDHGAAHTDHGSAHADHATAHDHAEPGHDAAPHDHGQGSHDHSSDDKCNICSASCSSLSLPSASAGIGEPVALSSVSFPGLSAPAPTFQSDGQERPPRTC